MPELTNVRKIELSFTSQSMANSSISMLTGTVEPVISIVKMLVLPDRFSPLSVQPFNIKLAASSVLTVKAALLPPTSTTPLPEVEGSTVVLKRQSIA